MGRRKRYEERVGLTLSTSMLEQIDARRKENEPRLDWIRDAIELRLNDDHLANSDTAWESTTVGYKRFVTDTQYKGFSEAARRWYKPYRCSSCSKPEDESGEYQASQPHTG